MTHWCKRIYDWTKDILSPIEQSCNSCNVSLQKYYPKMTGLVHAMTPYDRNDEAAWKALAHDFLQQPAYGEAFWYLSAGFDLLPLRIFAHPPFPELPKPGYYVFTDYGFTYKGLLEYRRQLCEVPWVQMPGDFSDMRLCGALPLRLFEAGERENLEKLYGTMNNKALPAPFDAFLLEFGLPQAETKQRVWYFVMDNRLFLEQVARPFALCFQYISTVTDGCRSGENAVCPNDALEKYATVLSRGGFWLTDHFNGPKPPRL